MPKFHTYTVQARTAVAEREKLRVGRELADTLHVADLKRKRAEAAREISETVRLADQKAAVGKAALEVIPIGRAPPPSRESREDAFPCQQRDNITVDVADLKRKRAEAAREMPLRWRCRALSLPHGSGRLKQIG